MFDFNGVSDMDVVSDDASLTKKSGVIYLTVGSDYGWSLYVYAWVNSCALSDIDVRSVFVVWRKNERCKCFFDKWENVGDCFPGCTSQDFFVGKFINIEKVVV